ncbi:MAG: hypothetical protein ABIL69_09100 [candidate division WOR-3 bacterium]
MFFISCSLFQKQNLYQKGLKNYEKKDYERAIKYFTEFYKNSPTGDSTLFFLYNCYIKIGDVQTGIKILGELAKRKNPSEHIYTNLFNYYHQNNLFYKINQMLLNAPQSVIQKFDQKYPLTKRRFAELLTGAISSSKVNDPVNFVIRKGLLKSSPDGKFYDNDTIKINQLILLLDSFISPVIPEINMNLKYIKADSYLYLPYLRLISLDILKPDENIDPESTGPLSMALYGITNLKNKGFIK